MVYINTNTLSGTSRTTTTAASITRETKDSTKTEGAAAYTTKSSTSSLSTLARQLSEAAVRADKRDTEMSFQALGQKAKSIVDQIVGNTYSANKAKHDAEVPDTDDPELLARAKQATDSINGKASNPFKGMSRDQLALITYDESGTFTVNERRAAWSEAYDQEQVWRRKVIQQGTDEYNRTGKLTNFFTEVLEYYKDLPKIEQAQYPADYETQLQGWIDSDFNYFTNQAEGKSKSPLSLIEQLLNKGL